MDNICPAAGSISGASCIEFEDFVRSDGPRGSIDRRMVLSGPVRAGLAVILMRNAIVISTGWM